MSDNLFALMGDRDMNRILLKEFSNSSKTCSWVLDFCHICSFMFFHSGFFGVCLQHVTVSFYHLSIYIFITVPFFSIHSLSTVEGHTYALGASYISVGDLTHQVMAACLMLELTCTFQMNFGFAACFTILFPMCT